MSTIRIASRYAKSLLELANQSNNLDTIKSDMTIFQEAIKNRDLYLLCMSPIVKAEKKLNIFKKIFEGKIDKLTIQFFEIIIKKRREKLFPEIVQSFMDQYNEQFDITTANLTTAEELSPQQLDKIKSKLGSFGVNPDKVKLNKIIDSDIIGGFILQIDDKLLDASVRSRLSNLKKELVDNA